jgi:hypothetical protein
MGLFSISLTLTFELGVDLHIWGPEFAGTARIKFYVVSFEVSFGDQSGQEIKPIEWAEFSQTFLPNRDSVCGVVFTGGLMQEVRTDDGKVFPILNGHELELSIQSQAPCSAVAWHTTQLDEGNSWSGRLGISPMFAGDLTSNMTAELKGPGGASFDADLFELSVVKKGFPAALWGQGRPDLSNPSSKLLDGVPAGVAVKLSERGKQGAVRGTLPGMPIEVFKYERIPKQIPWSGIRFPDDAKDPAKKTLSNTIWGDPDVSGKRAAIVAVLGAVTPYALNDVSLPLTAAQADTIFQAAPTFARLGQLLPEVK